MRAVGSNPQPAAGPGGRRGSAGLAGPRATSGTAAVLGAGIGASLRKARLSRGKSIEEASRETHIRTDYLRALERERLRQLLGDVYVRGFLRSYATYLGLDGVDVLAAYEARHGPPAVDADGSPLSPAAAPTPRRLLPRWLGHPSWRLLVALAVGVLAVFGALGLLSRSKATPPTTVPPSPEVEADAFLTGGVTVGIQAMEEVHAVVVADGQEVFNGTLRAEEARSFEGSRQIDVQLDRGGVALFTVNGAPIGTLGRTGRPLSRSFGPEDAPAVIASPSPSPESTGDAARRTSSGNSP